MGVVYILVKKNKAVHTYSTKLKDKYIADGYKHIFTIDGWNMSVSNKTI